MFRYTVFLLLSSFFPLFGFAQALANTSSAPASDPSSASPGIRTRPAASERSTISLQRLKVPPKARQLYDQALQAWGKHQVSRAQHKIDRTLQLAPDFPDALTLLGAIQTADRQWQSAERNLQAAIRSDPSFSPAYVVLAGVYNSEGRYDEAQRVTEQALAAGAATWSVDYEIVRALIGKGDYQGAVAVSDSALRSTHGALMHLARAHALLGLRRYSEAVADIRTYLHDEPTGDGSQDAHELLIRLQSFASR